VINLDQVSKVYDMGAVKVRAVDHLSLRIEPGEFVAVLGPSGSGKSTLMNLIGCLDTPTDGAYFLDDEPVQNLNRTQLAGIRNKKIGFVFQNFNLLAYATALEVKLFGRLHQEGKTLIIVTHDEKIASKCKRVIHLLDGRIDSDTLN